MVRYIGDESPILLKAKETAASSSVTEVQSLNGAAVAEAASRATIGELP